MQKDIGKLYAKQLPFRLFVVHFSHTYSWQQLYLLWIRDGLGKRLNGCVEFVFTFVFINYENAKMGEMGWRR